MFPPGDDVSPHKSREVIAEVQPVVRLDVIDERPLRKNHLTLAVRQSAIDEKDFDSAISPGCDRKLHQSS
jgi:hypothetical protein